MTVTAKRVESYRSKIEDRAEVMVLGDVTVLLVADGAGGRPGGAQAAETVVRVVRESLTGTPRCYDPRFWYGVLRKADEVILADRDAGESTAVVLAVRGPSIVGASVGDSGAWLITEDAFDDLTARQQHKPCLGTGVAAPMPFIRAGAGGTLLVASDGLFKYTGPEAICTAARGGDLDSVANKLVDLVRLPSGRLQDDVAVLLCRPEA
jgi:serine/threonine protein phosphatase PrpC